MKDMDRTILHCDCNGFYASVECILRPELRNVPMAVAGNKEERHGIILAKNEMAKAYKVKTAETIWQAKRKCPNLVVVPPHREEYYKYSKLVNEIYDRYTDMVEPFGIDESWLDVTGSMHLFGDGVKIADSIRSEVKRELGLTISVGVSYNKIFAKLGSDYKKPDATTLIDRNNYKSIVFPLPVDALLFVGKSSRETLHKIGIETIGDLANSSKEAIIAQLGKVGEMIHDYANGVEDSAVRPAHEESDAKSIGNGITFKRDLLGIDDIKIGVLALSDTVAARMRRHGVKCYTVQVMMRDSNFKTITRQRTLDSPTFLAREIGKISMDIISSSWNMKIPMRMLTITGANLVDSNNISEQISIFDNEKNQGRERQEKLEITLDSIRKKYGKNVVAFGGVLKNDLGIDTGIESENKK